MKKVKNKTKVFVGMSGGVDSSVAAYLLKKQKYDVVGVFIRGYNLDGCQDRDAEDARRVAEKIGIPFYTIDLEKEYKERVVDYMVSGYREGLTPNPDVACNKEIKFGLFLQKARLMGADFVATGHYVQLKRQPDIFAQGVSGATPKSYSSQKYRTLLFSASDKNKDQSYFLWTLTQNQLKHCLFPIGGYLKSEVRQIAKRAGLPTAEKKDSQGICFLGKFSLENFLKQRIPGKKGEVLTTGGLKIGQHAGAYFYTIGQRHLGDLKLNSPAGGKNSKREPLYVVDKNIKTNTLVVAEGIENPALFKKEIYLQDVNFINPVNSQILKNIGIDVLARVRYRQPLASALLKTKNSKLKIEFHEPVKFVAPGQSAVFYSKGGEMLGGGVIV